MNIEFQGYEAQIDENNNYSQVISNLWNIGNE